MRTTRRLALAAALGYAVLHVLGRRAGSTRQERRARLPGDELVPDPTTVTDHAITVAARAEDIWPWLTQMGWHLSGWYTPGWVDALLFPDNWPSLDRLDPALVRDLVVGDTVPDGPPGTAWFVVEHVDAPHLLVLHSTTHLPAAWRRYGAFVDWTWTLHLEDRHDSRTRVHLRVRGRTAPWWLTLAYTAALVPADYVMAVGMLRGIRDRAEAAPPPRASGRGPHQARGHDTATPLTGP